MNNTDELIEEISDALEEKPINSNSSVNNIETKEVVSSETVNNVANDKISSEGAELIVPPEGNYVPSKSKTPLLVVLTILLILDIAALVIYMIGIDKVLSFIK